MLFADSVASIVLSLAELLASATVSSADSTWSFVLSGASASVSLLALAPLSSALAAASLTDSTV